MEESTLFQHAEIIAIKGHDGDYWHISSFELGIVKNGTMFAAVSRTDSKQVVLIPYHAVLAIEVEYEYEQAKVPNDRSNHVKQQATVQDTVAA